MTNGAPRRGMLLPLIAITATLVGSGISRAQTNDGTDLSIELVDPKVLRVCADPRNLPFSRTKGRSSRLVFRPSTISRVLSEIHSSFTESLTRGKMRITSRPRVSMRIAEPSASMTSISLGAGLRSSNAIAETNMPGVHAPH